MARWECYVQGCTIYALAPDVRPVHAVSANLALQAQDPHCPIHKGLLRYVPTVIVGAVAATKRWASQFRLTAKVSRTASAASSRKATTPSLPRVICGS